MQDRAVPRTLADTDGPIQALRHDVSEQCVSIASSIDTIPSEMVPPEMRERWLRELRQAVVALVLVVERLAGGPPGRGPAMIAAIYARKRPDQATGRSLGCFGLT
jgi:hypothetical protein